MENTKPSNPSAFPFEFTYDDERTVNEGMTLRDYFANSAMQSLVSSKEQMEKLSELSIEDCDKMVAITSYRLADAMLKQRELNQ